MENLYIFSLRFYRSIQKICVFLVLINFSAIAQNRIEGWGKNEFCQSFVLNQPQDSIRTFSFYLGSILVVRNDSTLHSFGPANLNIPAGLREVVKVRGCYAIRSDSTVVDCSNSGPPFASTFTGVADVALGGQTLVLLGNGNVFASTGQANVPSGLTDVKAIAAGSSHYAALKNDGTVVVWGSNSSGQLNMPAGLSNVKAIAAWNTWTVALKNDGTVVSWGGFGFNTPTNLTGVTAIATGDYQITALLNNGTITSWGLTGSVPPGLNNVKEISGASTALKNDGTLVSWNMLGSYTSELQTVREPVSVAVGRTHTVVLQKDSTVVSWGDDSDYTMKAPGGLKRVISVAAGEYHTLALESNGRINGWGSNSDGQLSFPLSAYSNVKGIAAGNKHSVALKDDGTVLAWGSGQNNVPSGLTNVQAISAGFDYTMALKSNGTVVCWGGSSYVPPGLHGVVAIAAGERHRLALKSDGTVVGWKPNDPSYVVPENLTGVKAIFAGGDISAALKHDGTLVVWPANDFPEGLTNFKSVALGSKHIMALFGDKEPDEKVNSSLITGILYVDSLSNCLPEAAEPKLKGFVLKAVPGPYYGISGENGKYELKIPVQDSNANYSVSAFGYQLPTVATTPVCPPSNQYAITVDTLADTLSSKDFGFAISNCNHLDIQIASNRRRRCLKNTTSVSFVNQGSRSAPDAFVLVEFPKFVRPKSSTRPYVAINDSIWRFNLDTVAAGQSGNFTIIDSVICGNPDILGLTQCTKATIYPAPDCPLNTNWSGASLDAWGKCLGNGLVRLLVLNSGSGNMTDSTSYRIYLDSILVFNKKLKLVHGDSLLLNVQANGKTVRLESDQVANHPTQYSIVVNVEGCGTAMQNISKNIINKFPQPQTANSKIHCLPIQGSYDPNDKQVFPLGLTSNRIVKPGTQMEYLVRFQNTGNDTAFTVYVIDSLDNNLNPESIELGATSHPFEISMQTTKQGRTFLRWQFDNINLPDSNANELRSHGFFQYRISPKPGIALGSQARNEAGIYFDFNPPVITNQTLTTFDNITFTDTSLNDHVQIVVPATLALLTTTTLGSISSSAAISGGTISADGGATVNARGVCWSNAPVPTISLPTKTLDGSGTGTFTSNITVLQGSTTYYVRAYATNSVGTSYGDEKQFTTLAVATVASITTGNVTDITQTTALTSNEVLADGGAVVTARGVCWSTLPSPTIALTTKSLDGSGTGEFTSNITGLVPVTTYYVRAYATNSVGTAYGDERIFLTLQTGISGLEGSTGLSVYPNPFTNLVNFSSDSEVLVSVLITDVCGKEVLHHQFRGSEQVNLSHLASGIYYLKLSQYNHCMKLVKQ